MPPIIPPNSISDTLFKLSTHLKTN
jgi:hypothetical protein